MQEWQLPGGVNSLPYGTTVDDRDRLRIAETGKQPNRIVAFDAKRQAFVAAGAVPSGGTTVRYIYFHKPSRKLWFGTDAGTIAGARVP